MLSLGAPFGQVLGTIRAPTSIFPKKKKTASTPLNLRDKQAERHQRQDFK